LWRIRLEVTPKRGIDPYDNETVKVIHHDLPCDYVTDVETLQMTREGIYLSYDALHALSDDPGLSQEIMRALQAGCELDFFSSCVLKLIQDFA
jgi:hypothetical protein